MLRKLTLERFKSFERAEMEFGPLTFIVGPNASGKSNIREALRFLHGISRGYSLAEIIGEKWGEGGVLQWRGIRGGLRELAFNGANTFALKVEFNLLLDEAVSNAIYRIDVDLGSTNLGPRVLKERLDAGGRRLLDGRLSARGVYRVDVNDAVRMELPSNRPALAGTIDVLNNVVRSTSVTNPFASMRFLDLNPDAMRLPSVPGQVVLGDRGENLSSVLQAICADEAKKRALLGWMRELTPMDVVDFEFSADQTGRVLVTLVEESGRRVSAYSASDGTLRFLAMVAALMGPESARFYFFEEIENGLHPTRLALLLQLIEQYTVRGDVQVVATTHSAELLGLLGRDAQSHIVESYRREGSEATELTPVINLPDARRVIEEQGLARLHASGWIEDAVEFSAPDAAA